jgi:hypothetical protein
MVTGTTGLIGSVAHRATWPWKRAIDKSRDRFRLEQVEIAIANHRNFAESVNAIDFWRMRSGRRQAIGDTFFLANHARSAHKDGLLPNDLEFCHDVLPVATMRDNGFDMSGHPKIAVGA